MNILLTGHRGLIGTYLKKRLEEEGHLTLGIDKIEGKNVSFLKELIPSVKIDLVIHCAAFCKINKTIEYPDLAFGNAEDTHIVLEFCRKNNIKKIVYFSSSRVLNKEKNPYTASKIYGEELCKAYKDCYDIDYIIIRPSTVYGPVLDRTKRLMHIFIINALQDKDLIIFGDSETKTLDFTYVEDFVEGMMLTLNYDWNKEYNISGKEPFKVYDLAKFIIEETKSQSKIIIKDAETAQPQKVRLDTSEIEKIGYNPKVFLKEGVKKNIEYYKNLLKENPNVFNY